MKLKQLAETDDVSAGVIDVLLMRDAILKVVMAVCAVA